jgi:hypothetical protein
VLRTSTPYVAELDRRRRRSSVRADRPCSIVRRIVKKESATAAAAAARLERVGLIAPRASRARVCNDSG